MLLDLRRPSGRRRPARCSRSIRRPLPGSSTATRRSARPTRSGAPCRSPGSPSTSRRRCSPSRASTPARRSARTGPARSSSPPRARPRSASQPRLAACVAWRLGGATTYCLDGQVYTAGAAVTWLERLGPDRRGGGARSARRGRRRGRGDEVIFVPALAGLAAPFWRPAARGAGRGPLARHRARRPGAGADLGHRGAGGVARARAIAADLGRPLERLRVDGGLTRSASLMQAQADLLQAPVELYPSPDATALGVAAFARLGAGAAARRRRQPSASGAPPRSSSRGCRPTKPGERLGRWERAATALAELGSPGG